MERDARQEIRVGLFVVGLLLALGVITWVIGGGSKMIAPRYTLNAHYKDVQGLKVGAVVRLAGVDVGEVTKVDLQPSEGGNNVHVELTVRREYQPKITEDSTAGFASIGVLGDMFITLSVGSVNLPPLADGATIRGTEPQALSDYANKVLPVVDNAESITRKLDLMLGSDDDAAQGKLGRSLDHIESMLSDAQDGNGLLHTLLYDPKAGERIDAILGNVETITDDVAGLTTEVRTGSGIAHALIYGDGGKDVSALLASVNGLVDDVKTKDSLIHSVLYDPEQARLLTDARGTLENLKAVTDAIDDGDGTLGLLVRDPQLYEDLRLLFGGAQRNALLRAYVRATVARARDEEGAAGRAPSDDPDQGGR